MEPKDDKLTEYLRIGGQKRMRMGGGAVIYDQTVPKRTRKSNGVYKTMVTGFLDARLDLTTEQRAIGNCYGAYFEQAHTGGSSEFLREFVDGGSFGGGGFSERQAAIVAMVVEAQGALSKTRAVRYKKPKPRKGGKSLKAGRHLPIPMLTLIDAVCVHGHSLEAVAVRFQWFMIKQTGDQTKHTAPWRQQRKIADGIRDGLLIIQEAWEAKGMKVPSQFGTVEVE